MKLLVLGLFFFVMGCSKFHTCPMGTTSAGNKMIKYCEKTAADGQNVRHGEEWLYDQEGKLRRKATYDMGKITGVATLYHPNGKVRGTQPYVNGVPEGKFEGFTEAGKKFEEFLYVQGDIVSGESRFPNGKIQRIVKTDEKGSIQDETFFEDGKKATLRTMDAKGDGKQTDWHPNGQVKTISVIKNGNLDGMAVQFYDTGAKRREVLAKNGNFDGPVKIWHPNGKLEVVGQHAKDFRVGKWIYTDSKARKSKIEEYPGNSDAPKAVTFFNENGTPKIRTEFTENQVVKTRIEYDTKGTQLAKFTCENGKVIKADPEDSLPKEARQLAGSPKCHYEEQAPFSE